MRSFLLIAEASWIPWFGTVHPPQEADTFFACGLRSLTLDVSVDYTPSFVQISIYLIGE